MYVFTLVEHRAGKVESISYELISAAKNLTSKLGGKVSSIVLTHDVKPLLKDISKVGLDSIIYIEDKVFEQYSPEAYVEALYFLVKKYSPDVLLVGHTSIGLDCAPRLAVKLNSGLVSHVVDMKVENGELIFVRETLGNKMREDILLLGEPPKIAAITPGCYMLEEEEAKEAELVKESLPAEVKVKSKAIDLIKPHVEEVDISKAEVIVSGGRGLGDKKAYHELIVTLAELLGGEAAGSRPTMDYGWIPRSRVVGSSGKTVAPKLYMAIGISGASQHVVGMRNSKCIIAINKDPKAPIFNVAHYGVVGDLFEIVPKLIEKMKMYKEFKFSR